ncbi:LuxR C-terminal-related transcriptional regulator [Cellulosimicrobium funkei]|uniref:LuxR C-terminal-related transcriptional regulator n=1 Tax=Cellulosimicrobium funkei TaxID=264251 RepID=UPI0036B4DEF6
MSDAFWSADEPEASPTGRTAMSGAITTPTPATVSDEVLREACALLPRAHGTVHPRRAVDQALHTGPALITLHAPRGFGATTAVAAWARDEIRHGSPVLWLSARAATPGRQQRVTPDEALATWVNDAFAYLDGTNAPTGVLKSPGAVAARLDAAGATLVLDDVGPATRGLLEAVSNVASRLVRARAVVITTARPEGNGMVLTLDDLAVTPDEVAEATKASRADLATELTELLSDRLAGWATGVYGAVTTLASTATRGETPTEDLVLSVARRHRARALQDLPRDVTELLLDLAVADEFDVSDLALLTSVPHPHDHLDRLHDVGAVGRIQGRSGPVYAIRPRLRRALVDVARQRHPARFRARALGVAAERLERGETRRALQLELEAGDTTQAARTLLKSWTTLLDGSDDDAVDALWSAAGTVPRSHLPPRLVPLLAAIRGARGGLGPTGSTGSTAPPSGDVPTGDELDLFLRAVAQRRSGQRETVVASAQAWLAPASTSLPAERRGDRPACPEPAALVLLALQASLAAIELGRPGTASRLAQRAHHEAVSGGLLRLASAGASLAALAEALGDDLREARAWLHEASALPEPPRWWSATAGDMPGLVGALDALASAAPEQARLIASAEAVERCTGTDLWAVGLHIEAAAGVVCGEPELAVDHVRSSLTRRGLVRGQTDERGRGSVPALELAPPLVTAALGRLALALGHGTTATAAETALPATSTLRTLLAARAAIARGDGESALHGAAALTTDDGLPVGQRTEAHVVVAEALHRAGDGDGARSELARAASFARRHGSLLPFRWSSPSSLSVLLEASDASTRELLVPLRPAVAPNQVRFVHMPERQLLVLQALADGLTGAQIAQAFFVSRNTVKTQVREIYRRLGVHDKASAVRQARDLGLLDPLNRKPDRDR